MRLVVIGHVEWVEFARVPELPRPGEIVHATETWEEAAGGGAVAAVQLAKLAGDATLFTALGDDELGERSLRQLRGQGVRVQAARPESPTRRAFTHVDEGGERTITVLGTKLVPRLAHSLALGGARARRRRLLRLRRRGAAALGPAGARARRDGARAADGRRGRDRARRARRQRERRGGDVQARRRRSAAEAGGLDVRQGGRLVEPGRAVLGGAAAGAGQDAYGCGDAFAAGLTFALARGDEPRDAIALAARCGAAALTGRGGYAGQLRLHAAEHGG